MDEFDKSVKKEVEDVREYLENIIALIPGHIYWKDLNCRFLGCNDAQAKIAGLSSRHDIVGKSSIDIISKNQPESLRRQQAQAIDKVDRCIMRTGVPETIEEPLILEDGTEKIYLSQKVALRDKDNNIIGLLGVPVDITARKEAELREKEAIARVLAEQTKAKIEEELRQAVMIITGSIVHDIRTPLTTLGINSHNLAKTLPILLNAYHKAVETKLVPSSLNNDQITWVNKISHSIENIAQEMEDYISHSLKTLSKSISKSLAKDDLVTCSMLYCVKQAVDRYPFNDKERKLIKFRLDKDFIFLGNDILMIRVLLNLIKNSLYQICKNKKGEIYIELENSNHHNYLHFRDTAGGASQEVIETIFEGYLTQKKRGTGIGLAFVKKTICDFGGQVACFGEYGNYIEFTLKFPTIKK